jgi:hypothetical protein
MNIKNAFYAMVVIGFMSNAIIVADEHTQSSKLVDKKNVVIRDQSGCIVVLSSKKQIEQHAQEVADSIIVKDTVVIGVSGMIIGSVLGVLDSANKSSDRQLANALYGGVGMGIVGSALGYLYGATRAQWLLKEIHGLLHAQEAALQQELIKQN